MTAIAYAITTKEKVKSQLGITDSGNDTLIDSLIGYVTDFIEGQCGGRRFKSTTYTRQQYDTCAGHNDVFLKHLPVTAVTLVEYRTGALSNPSWVTYNADNYIPYLEEGYIHFFATLGDSHLGLGVTYTAGFLIDFSNETNATLHTLPADISGVATDIIAQMINTKGADGIQSQSTEGQSITFKNPADFVTPMHKAVLSRYTVNQGV